MNTAQTIAAIASNARASAFDYGYSIDQNGKRVEYERGKQLADKRNASGRCTRHERQYADGSILVFTWSDDRGARFTTRTAKQGVTA